MSASTEKKNRGILKEAGNDKRAQQAKEEAQKKAISKRRWTLTAIGIVVLVALIIVLNSPALFTKTTAVVIGGKSYSPTEVNYNYANQYYSFANNYGSYASMFGLDTSSGISGLANQECAMSEDGQEGYTWKDYFLDSAISVLKQSTALLKYAEENNITLTDEEKAEVEEGYADLEETAVSYGYASADNFIAAQYGTGANVALAQRFDTDSTLASKAYEAKSDELNAGISDEEVGEKYPTVAARHILVKAVADENGEYTDEAKAEALSKIREICKEWRAGDATEESFAALAEEYSEDDGSNTNGGLYNAIMEGEFVTEFNDFIFDENREPGDTRILYGESSGSYAGYHLVYFVGEGDPADNETGRNYILSDLLSDWLTEITDAQSVEKKFFFRLAGKI